MTPSNTYLKQNLALAWPLAVNGLLVQSMLMIDTILVAPLGQIPVAAMGIATALVMFALGVLISIGNGIQLVVGRASGSGNQDDLVVAFWVGTFLNLATALIFFAIFSLFAPELVAALTADAGIEKQVLSYLDITKYIVLLTALTQVCTAYYNGRGNTKVSLKGFLIEIPVNAILSYLLIYGVGTYGGLGLVGAAWGSLAAVFLRTAYFAVVMQMDRSVEFRYPRERPFRSELGPQTAEISPVAVNFFVLFIGAAIYQLLYAQLELSSFVAITLIFPWLRIGTQFVSAWAQASAISISQALGRGETGHLNEFISACTRTVLVLSLAVALLFYLLSQFIHLIYPGIEFETLSALAIIAPLYILLPIVRGYNSLSGNILRALGESNRVLRLNFTAQWIIALPACALLILYFDVSVFWAFAVMPLEEILKIYYFYRYTKMKLDSEYSDL